MASVKPIPDEYPQVTPYLAIDGASAAIDFYTTVFGAIERVRMPGPGDTIGHAELQIGNSIVMLSDEMPEMGIVSPKGIGGSPVTFNIYVEDVDKVFAHALELGATSLRDVANQL